MNYRFVKIKRGKFEIWYFNPRTRDQVIDHFNIIFGAEIKDGMRDFVKGIHVYQDKNDPDKVLIKREHPTTPFLRAVEVYMQTMGGTFIEAAVKLENETLQQRLKSFDSGKEMYLDNGVVETRLIDTDKIIEEYFSDNLVYPQDTYLRLEDVRYMQWNMPDLNMKGTHWYAKIGKLDIVDEHNNMKWDTKEEAEKAAEWFIRNKISFKRYTTFI